MPFVGSNIVNPGAALRPRLFWGKQVAEARNIIAIGGAIRNLTIAKKTQERWGVRPRSCV